MQKKDFYARWSKEQINEMIDLHKNGKTFWEIGEQYNITHQRVQQLLNKAGYKPARKNRSLKPRKTKHPILERDLLVKFYVEEELSIPQMEEKLKLPYNQIRKSLLHYKIKLRPGGFYRRSPLTAELLENLYLEQAMTAREIAARLGYSSIAIAMRLSQLGIKKSISSRRTETLPPK